MYTSSIHTALDIALSNESTQSYNRAIKNIALLIESMRETSDSIKTHEENIYIIGASQALMVVFDKNPDEVERYSNGCSGVGTLRGVVTCNYLKPCFLF